MRRNNERIAKGAEIALSTRDKLLSANAGFKLRDLHGGAPGGANKAKREREREGQWTSPRLASRLIDSLSEARP